MTTPLLLGENESPILDVESPPIKPNSMYTNNSNNDAGNDIAVTVDTASLKSKIVECRQRLVSGKMGFAVASTAGNCGHQGARRMATAPFVDSFDAELCRISDVLLNLRLSAESSAVAMLKQADIISHSKDMMEVSTLKSEAISLQTKVSRIGQVTRDNISELTRIALEADSQLGTTSAVKANRCFESEPWVDSGSIVIFLSDIFSILRSIEESSDAKKDGKWVAPSSFERGEYIISISYVNSRIIYSFIICSTLMLLP